MSGGITRRDRYRGALLGLAAGDAVGTTLEFERPGTFVPITDMTGGGPFGLRPGEWTDDTSMALCLAESLVERRGHDAADQMARYVRWWRHGHLSSNGRCFDIGNTVSSALARFERTGNAYAGSDAEHAAGNGSLMRLAPVPMAYSLVPRDAIAMALDSSLTTHGTETCADACRYFAGLLVGALRGVDKEELLAPRYTPVPGLWDCVPLCAEIDRVAAGSFRTRRPPEIRGTGYVVESLEAALWAFATTENFRDACLAAANLGDDADTTAAITGQIAGAHLGVGGDGVPVEWVERLALREVIDGLADRLFELSDELGDADPEVNARDAPRSGG